ncbi:RNA polymerase factor sigma-54 [Dichotomicrobium thermohalophilum]|uniref:RNA polymerase sigma-54 factor n=1 Tax=Dichotomicrobium thermohalophilum TaxID=933063 RepID=A0A397Q6R0_9HYPH|nr:RNA polymerase factor sigma-54 [Dichotomicrobium thermohalophilum]RIA56643.1 RNA polymerase RpoN-/SigL-like sigma 54 subunit [Dichotomicrobium thermohalophilum]
MALRLELKPSQSLVMTPQLQQSIKLLQLSNLELASVIDRELAENPLLQRAEEAEAGESTVSEADFSLEQAPFPEGGASLSTPQAGASGEPPPGDFAPPEGPSLRAHLEEQLSLAAPSPKERMIGLNLIDMIDEAGYLRGDTGQLAERLNVAPEDVERVLTLLQSFDPAGVGARGLPECLEIQLREQGRLDPMIATLLRHLDLIAAQDLPKLARLCEADIEDVRDMIAEIRRLNPKPGLCFGGAPVAQITPDVVVRARPDGNWHVELNGQTLPRLLVDRAYFATVRAQASHDDRAFLGDCLNAANWLVRSLDQRARTILKVAEEIVRRQDGFLRHGAEHLQPMTLRDVAAEIDMHESTVSRASAHKYMATPRGLFEFRYFFTSAVAAADGASAHSSEAVRHRIKQLVDAETPDSVLSDDQIVEALKASGIDIARRTVAKYRDLMRIPSSRERRRAKKLELMQSG